MIVVRSIDTERVIEIRHPILRPGRARETAIFDGDTQADTIHLGGFLSESLCAVATLMARDENMIASSDCWQLRGMATSVDARKLGLGRELVVKMKLLAEEQGRTSIWCNARENAAPFYERMGFAAESESFDIAPIGQHYRMRWSRA